MNFYYIKSICIAIILVLSLSACQENNEIDTMPPESDPIYRIPIVVHVMHLGEPIGEGYNLSKERIEGQIRILNQDYRRKEGTPGFNTHPDGGDARIEFVLAKSDPNGLASDGIVRININAVDNPINPNAMFDYYAHFSYWEPALYLNVWSIPLPGLEDLVLGEATGPETDLPGADLFTPGEPWQAEGVIIHAPHFGISERVSDYNLGRTLTHEIGHYLGLLHTWGDRECATNDFCEDTPPVSQPVLGCPANPGLACDGQIIMIENYMNYGHDRCMNVFTNDQIARMHYVLENSPRRKSLLSSPALSAP